MSAGKVFVWCIVVSVVVLGGVVYALTRDGMSARQGLSRPTDYVLGHIRMSAVKAAAPSTTNPYADHAGAWREGGVEYEKECAMCHGDSGRGDGKLARMLYPPAPNLASDDTQHMTDGELYQVIHDGIRLSGMPAWADDMPTDELWKVTTFLRQLPTISSSDVEQLKQQAGSGDQD